VAYDEHGRMWVERPFWTQATYVVDRNLTGLSWEERKEMENASEHYGDLARFTHYRSIDTVKTFWDERIIMIPLKNEASDAMGTATWARYAQVSIQVRYGDIRVSVIAGQMAYSTPRMYLPHVDRYTEWELAMFREPGRTLDALTGVISGAEKDALPPSEWICPCGAGLDYICEKLRWEHIDRSIPAGDSAHHMNVGIAPYVAVEDIAWLERQLAARRNINIQLGDVKKIRAESARWEKAEQAGVKLLAAPVDVSAEKTERRTDVVNPQRMSAEELEEWNQMQEDGERMEHQEYIEHMEHMERQDEDRRARTGEE
jgi:hypothetical protein